LIDSFEVVLFDDIGLCGEDHAVLVDCDSEERIASGCGGDDIHEVEFFFIVDIEQDQGAETLDEEDFWMGGVSDDLLGRKVVDTEAFHGVHIDRKLNSAFEVVFALHDIVDIDGLDIFPQNIKVSIGGGDVMNLRLLMPLVGDIE
jgi:hypothetical protein